MQIWAEPGKIGPAHSQLFTNLISVFNVYTKLETVSTKKIPSIFGCPACLLQGTGSRNKQLACTVSAAGKHKAVMPANIQLASVTAFFVPYVRMV